MHGNYGQSGFLGQDCLLWRKIKRLKNNSSFPAHGHRSSKRCCPRNLPRDRFHHLGIVHQWQHVEWRGLLSSHTVMIVFMWYSQINLVIPTSLLWFLTFLSSIFGGQFNIQWLYKISFSLFWGSTTTFFGCIFKILMLRILGPPCSKMLQLKTTAYRLTYSTEVSRSKNISKDGLAEQKKA